MDVQLVATIIVSLAEAKSLERIDELGRRIKLSVDRTEIGEPELKLIREVYRRFRETLK